MEGFEAIKGYVDPFGNAPLSYSSDDHNGGRDVVPLQVRDGRWVLADG